MNKSDFKNGISVKHERFGFGSVEVVTGETAIVRFGDKLEQCLCEDLEIQPGVRENASSGKIDCPRKTLSRGQALCIRSINDSWGVFSPSRISLFPHQLWVCHKVSRAWPMRWLIADDVGLGKTIEAGLILWPLLSRKKVNRFMILCPASLVKQWCLRLLEMFDISSTEYQSVLDGKDDQYWLRTDRVVASFHTLRDDSKGRWDRMADGDKWDLVIVDEAHHLNVDERQGKTKAYRLIEYLEKHDKIESLLLFTGTPHRGKNYGFYSLMKLLRPDIFNPDKPIEGQVENLRSAVIRNNKQSVTNLSGEKLFKPMQTQTIHYQYNDEEQLFYESLSSFIKEGKTYAKTLELAKRTAVGLILSTMQKLAASSIAAVASAMKKRRASLEKKSQKIEELRLARQSPNWDDENSVLADMSEEEAEKALSQMITVLKDEDASLDHLIGLSGLVQSETKLDSIINLVEKECEFESVLFFTEYKVTQGLLVQLLSEKWGKEKVGFINGDNILILTQPDGAELRLSSDRRDVANAFNSGRIRFLVSTEAAGEGVDLQKKCRTLIHVDLPWNPMRLHQRVGRLNRIGQNREVQVYNFTNPTTIESKIWSMLNHKIDSIMLSVGSAMEEPEDLRQIVLGTASDGFYEDLFHQSTEVDEERLESWFDEKTSTMGGRDAIDLVDNLIGNAAKFDYHGAVGKIPKVDIKNLMPFFKLALKINGRRVSDHGDALGFITPSEWQVGMTPDSFDRLSFLRKDSTEMGEPTVGVGNAMTDAALAQAIEYPDCISCYGSLENEIIFLFSCHDKLTGSGDKINSITFGVLTHITSEEISLLQDWELLVRLNEIKINDNIEEKLIPFNFLEILEKTQSWIEDKEQEIDTGFKIPVFKCECVICPKSS